MAKKRKETLIGWTENNWSLAWKYICPWWKSIDITEITEEKKAYTMRKNPVKIRITIEEI